MRGRGTSGPSRPGTTDRALWARGQKTEANPQETERFLDLAGYVDRWLDDDERERVAALIEHDPLATADVATARAQADAVDKSMSAIRKLLPRVGSYVWETDFFQPNWQDAFWGENYARLRAVKDKYDPAGLFFLHHGVGSEDWSADGFTRVN